MFAIDHFVNTGNVTTDTYAMRYLLDDTNFVPETGCILFYAGNEGGIYSFYDNSGFVTETLAVQYQGLVVFGEHRYYGTSMPFGDASFDQENLVYFTVEQAMMDFVNLI